MAHKSLLFTVILMLTIMLAGCSSSFNELNGPSWDVTLRLPVESGTHTVGELVGASEFAEFGYSYTEPEAAVKTVDTFFIGGTDDRPIKKEVELPLPELTLDLPLIVYPAPEVGMKDVTLEPYTEVYLTVPVNLQFKTLILGQSPDQTANQAAITVTNTGTDWLDDFYIYVNNEQGKRLGYVYVTSPAAGNSSTFDVDLNGAELTQNLELEIDYGSSYRRSMGIQMVLNSIQAVKIEELDTGEFDPGSLSAINLDQAANFELGTNAVITRNDDSNSNLLTFTLNQPATSSIELNINSLTLGGTPFTQNGNVFFVDAPTLNLNGELAIGGELTLVGNPINYDVDSGITAVGELVGDVGFDNPGAEMTVDQQDARFVYYQVEPMLIETTQQDIDRMREGIKEAYLHNTFTNTLLLDLTVDFYLGSSNDPALLYTAENKVSPSLISIVKGDSSVSRVDMNDSLDRVQQLLTAGGPVYLGAEMRMGDPDKVLEIDSADGLYKYIYRFQDTETVDLSSYMGVELKINQ